MVIAGCSQDCTRSGVAEDNTAWVRTVSEGRWPGGGQRWGLRSGHAPNPLPGEHLAGSCGTLEGAGPSVFQFAVLRR